jgi:hypothetical protein
MAHTTIPSEFLGSTRRERLVKCRQFAAEAGSLAEAAVNTEMRRAYLDLKRQWEGLAAELEELLENGEPEEPSWNPSGDLRIA